MARFELVGDEVVGPADEDFERREGAATLLGKGHRNSKGESWVAWTQQSLPKCSRTCDLSSAAAPAAETPKFVLDELEIGLTLTAEGKLAFVACVAAEVLTITATFRWRA